MSQSEKLLKLLSDGRYHTTSEIVETAGHSSLRRLREMRSKGVQIETIRMGNNARYKLAVNVPSPPPVHKGINLTSEGRIEIRRKFGHLTRLPGKPTVETYRHVTLDEIERKNEAVRRLVFRA